MSTNRGCFHFNVLIPRELRVNIVKHKFIDAVQLSKLVRYEFYLDVLCYY